jgi:chromosome segregation protein
MVGLKRALFGYSSGSVQSVLADRELMFERASREAQSAEERAERLASELSEAKLRLGEAEERLGSSQELGETLAADLERSVAEREAMQARLTALHEELSGVNAGLAAAEAAIAARDHELHAGLERTAGLEIELAEHRRQRDELAAQLASARDGSVALQEELRQRNELLAKADAEESKAQAWLRRALEESAGYKQSLTEEQARVAELEELLGTYRAELEERAATPVASRDEAAEESGGPSSARELAAVLQVTEEAVVRIMESTRARADEELRNVDHDRERIGREVDALKAWRDRAAPMIVTLQSTMDEVIGHANEIGVRINEVLRPVTGAVARLGSQLSSLDSLPTPTPPAETAADQHEGARVIELRDDQAAGREIRRDQ